MKLFKTDKFCLVWGLEKSNRFCFLYYNVHENVEKQTRKPYQWKHETLTLSYKMSAKHLLEKSVLYLLLKIFIYYLHNINWSKKEHEILNSYKKKYATNIRQICCHIFV